MTRTHQAIVLRLADLAVRGCYFEVLPCGCTRIGPSPLLTAADRDFLDAHQEDVRALLVAVAAVADAEFLAAPVGDAVH